MIGLTGLIEINCRYSHDRVIDGHVSNTKTYILAKTCCAVLYRLEQRIDNVAKSNPNFILRYALETKIQSGVHYKHTITPLWFKKVHFCSEKKNIWVVLKLFTKMILITPKILLTLIHPAKTTTFTYHYIGSGQVNITVTWNSGAPNFIINFIRISSVVLV